MTWLRAILAFLIALPGIAQAQSWPSGTITIVVGVPAGGSVDAVARLAQAGLQQRLGVPVVVENRPGASASLGAAAVAKAKPDGNTWLIVYDNHAINPSLLPKMTFDTENDLEPVMLVGTAPYVIATHPGRPYTSFKEMLAVAKARPGDVKYANVLSGSVGHLAMVLLAKRADVSLTTVNYRGGAPALTDIIGGHVDLIIASTGLLNAPVQANVLRPLLQTGKTRAVGLENVPTAIEEGFGGFEANAWWGVFAPKATPAAILDRFRTSLAESLGSEKERRQLVEVQLMTVLLAGPEVLRPFLSEQMRYWGAVVRENNIKPAG